MITLIARNQSAPLTDEDVYAWAGLHLRNDVMYHWLREHSPLLDQRDAARMFAETDARDESRATASNSGRARRAATAARFAD